MRHRTLWVALGLAEAKSQHDPLEAEALSRWAEGKRTLLEIGVAEGASARLRRSMDPTGKLWCLCTLPSVAESGLQHGAEGGSADACQVQER